MKTKKPPFYPVGPHVLVLLDEDEDLNVGTLTCIGSGVPDNYFIDDDLKNSLGIRLGQRVLINSNYILREYVDEPSIQDVVNYEPTDDDYQDQPPPKYALVHIDGIYGILNTSSNKK